METREVILSGGKTIEIKGMTGHEEKIFRKIVQKMAQSAQSSNSDSAARVFIQAYKVIDNCVLKVDSEDVRGKKNFNIIENLEILTAIRSQTYGDLLAIEMKCPECKKKIRKTYSLDEVRFTPPKIRNDELYEVDLPESGQKASVSLMTTDKEVRLSRLTNPDHLDSMLLRVNRIDDHQPAKKELEEMSGKDLQAIRNGFMEIDGEYDAEAEIWCDDCDYSMSFDLILNPLFFSPLRT